MRVSASAYGVTSNAESPQTPATSHAVTVRTEFPQASRVVSPTPSSRRMRGLHVLDLQEVKLHVLPRGHVAEAAGKLVGDVGERFELNGEEAPEGDLHAEHLRVASAAGRTRRAGAGSRGTPRS